MPDLLEDFSEINLGQCQKCGADQELREGDGGYTNCEFGEWDDGIVIIGCNKCEDRKQ